jgi:CMP-N-acetylneuraminic acid synthetase
VSYTGGADSLLRDLRKSHLVLLEPDAPLRQALAFGEAFALLTFKNLVVVLVAPCSVAARSLR